MHLNGADVAELPRQRREEFGGKQKFLLGKHFPAHPLTNRRGAVIGPRSAHDPGGERPQQRQIAHVTEEHRSGRRQQARRQRQHIQQVTRAGEILDDRVEHHDIEISLRQPIWRIGRLDPELNPITPRLRAQRRLQPLNRRCGEIGAPVLLACRSDLRQQQPRTHTDLENPLRAQSHDAINGRRPPFPHLIQRYRLAGVTADPAAEILTEHGRFDLGLRLRIDAAPHSLPLLDKLLLALRLPNQHQLRIENDIAAQQLVVVVIGPALGRNRRSSDDHGLRHTGMGCQYRLDLAEFDAVPADLDLLIGTSLIQQLTIRAPAHQIAGAIHPGSRTVERARHEP